MVTEVGKPRLHQDRLHPSGMETGNARNPCLKHEKKHVLISDIIPK